MEEASDGFKTIDSGAGLGDVSDFIGRIGDGDATSDVLIRRSGVLDGEEGDRDTEEEERADVDATGEDATLVTGEDDPVKIGEDDFDKAGEEDVSFADDPASVLFAYACGTGSRITSDEEGVSSPRATRFAYPNSLDEAGRFSVFVSSETDCKE